jgi:hypothetical protein
MKCAVAGALAQRSDVGGHWWAILQYVLGLRDLGWEVCLIDALPASSEASEAGHDGSPSVGELKSQVMRIIDAFGLTGSYVLLSGEEGEDRAIRTELLARLRDSAFLLNVNGFIEDVRVLEACRRRIFLDIDPGFYQMWTELGLYQGLSRHDSFVTLGRNVGLPGCEIPTCGLNWMGEQCCVLLVNWPMQTRHRSAFTSVGAWRGPYDPVEYGKARYGLRAHEFRKFVDVARRVEVPLEIALQIDDWDQPDKEMLEGAGWILRRPADLCYGPPSYRVYVQNSMAEFGIAKGMYVQTNSGWFSDRSACYLASGKPVVLQETGFSRYLPTGEGLLSFSTVDEAVEGIEEVCRDYDRHSRAARWMAEEYFDSRKVLTRMLERLEVA